MKFLLNLLKYSPLGIIAMGLLYLVLKIRHFLFDQKLLSTKTAPVYSIGLGNIEVGGSGKTPHAIYFLKKGVERSKSMGFISRGYGRTHQGDQKIDRISVSHFGDEPSLVYSKLKGEIEAVVAKQRIQAYPYLEHANCVILDDALQHRAIELNHYITITRFQDPFTRNYLFPIGSCRDIRHALKRSKFLIISYCPTEAFDLEQYVETHQLQKYFSPQHILFSRMETGNPKCLVSCKESVVSSDLKIHLISGIAKPGQFREDVEKLGLNIEQETIFPDHYTYSKAEIQNLVKEAVERNLSIVLTEKDGIKWKEILASEQLNIPKQVVFEVGQTVIPINKEAWNRIEDLIFD